MHTPGPPGFAAHWVSLEQRTHLCVAVSQIGRFGSPLQSTLLLHSTHAPLAGSQTGACAPLVAQAALPPANMQDVQVFAATLHSGVLGSALQYVWPVHST